MIFRNIFINLSVIFLIYSSNNSAFAQLRINELSPSTTATYYDEDNDFYDWVEIYNSGSSAVNLSGYYLSNKTSNLSLWNFPSFSLGAGQYYLVMLTGKNRTSPNVHANFTISKNKTILLTTGTAILDSLTVPDIPANTSMKRSGLSYTFYQTLTPLAANVPGVGWFLSEPVISPSGGFYSSNVTVILSHWFPSADIRYTLDGTEPTLTSTLYTAPFIVSKPTEPNGISSIPTNPSLTYPVGSYDSVRANNRGWVPPYDTVNKCAVVRAKAFYTGAIPSRAVSNAYFIEPLLSARYSMPVVSLSADTTFLFGNKKGIYVFGNGLDANYNREGDSSEIPVNIQVFDRTGSAIAQTLCGARIHGGGGRHSAIKSFKLFFRDSYGASKLTNYFFDNYIQDEHSNIILRNPGHRPDCIGKDELAMNLTGGIRLDKPRFKQSILFINNEYWGIHSFREAVDANYFSHKYNIPKSEITILDPEGQLENGLASDTLLYASLEDYVSVSDLNVSTNYDFVKSQMDVDNFIDFYACEIFLGNGDWPNNNVKFWRKNTVTPSVNLPYGNDGRWRWILYDLDGGFGGSCGGTYPTFNAINQATSTAPQFGSYTKLFRGLLGSTQFKNDFINRICDLMNSQFSYKYSKLILDTIANLYNPEMMEHVVRWRYPSVATDLISRYAEIPSLTRWNNIKSQLDYFLIQRPFFQRKHLYNYFSLIDSSIITINVNDTLMGMVKLNSLYIDLNLPGTSGATYPWSGIYFDSIPLKLMAIPKPGYKFLNWLETGNTSSTITVYLIGDSIQTAIFGIDSNYDSTNVLHINEVSSSNNSWIADEAGEYDDWVEIYNPSNDTIDLNGFYLSDDITLPNKFLITSGSNSTKIYPKGYKLFWCDNQTLQGNLHTNFALSAIGEKVFLTKPDGITVIDSLQFSTLPIDYSFGSFPNGTKEYTVFNYPTPNESNNVTGIENLEDQLNFLVYPNPANDQLNVVNLSEGQIQFSLFSQDGKCTMTEKINPGKTSLNTGNLAPGFYAVYCNTFQSVKHFKLIVSH